MGKVTRRDFLRYLGVGSIGYFTRPLFPFALKGKGFQPSDVVQCFDENATTGSTVNDSVVQIMMDESIKALTGISNVGEAWKSIFAGITENSAIGIKVNCLFQTTTHRELVNCIINGLTEMDFSGSFYKKNNIIIWDNQDNLLAGNGGYTIYDGTDPDTVRCFGTNHSGVGYDSTNPLLVNGVTSNPSRILSVLCNYIINAGVIKNHSISTTTLTLKNNYGSINNPGSLHNNHCDPYIPSLNQQIRDVITPNNIQKIFIADALFGCYSGGPSGPANCNPKKIIMSFDPVACDYQGQNLINEERTANGLPEISASHIITASQPPYNLGTTEVNLIEINNPSGIEESETAKPQDRILKISPNPFRKKTTITFSLSSTCSVHLDLINPAGRIVTRIHSGQLSKGRHRIDYNVDKRLSGGTYYIRFFSSGKTYTEKVIILK